jgi:hypothetical protein
VTIGTGAAGIDYDLLFDGETNDGTMTWLEDENSFQMVRGIKTPRIWDIDGDTIVSVSNQTGADDDYVRFFTSGRGMEFYPDNGSAETLMNLYGTRSGHLEHVLINFYNAASMTGVGTGVGYGGRYNGQPSGVTYMGYHNVVTEGNWTSTASTQDARWFIELREDGTIEERMNLSSSGGFATGKDYALSMKGQVASGYGSFATDGDAQSSKVVVRNQTTDASVTDLFIDGSALTLVVPTDTAWGFVAYVVGRQTGGAAGSDGDGAYYKLEGMIENTAGTTALVGSVTKTLIAEDTAAWDVSASADDGNDSLEIKVNGAVNNNINWVATVHLTEVAG